MSKRLKLPPHSLSLDFSKLTPVSSQPEVKQENEYLGKKPKLDSGTKSENMILCFDWDGTMVKGSLHNYLENIAHTKFVAQLLVDGIKDWGNKAQLVKLSTTESDLECHVDQFLKDETKSWKNKKQLETLLTKASDLGCHIAIVSFGSYLKEIKYALTKLGLEQTTLEKIHVVSYLPDEDEMRYTGKQNHIKEAMKHFEVYDNKKVVLIDDNSNNVNKALDDNMGAIYVDKDDTKYLDQAFKILDKVPTQKATNQPSEYTVSQDSLDQSTSISTDSGLELLGERELTSDSD